MRISLEFEITPDELIEIGLKGTKDSNELANKLVKLFEESANSETVKR